MRIKLRLHLGAIVSVIVMAAITSAVFIVAKASEKTLRTSAEFSRLEHQVFALNLLSKSYLLHPRERVKEQWESVHNSLGNRLTEMILEKPDQASSLRAIMKDHEEVALSFAQLADMNKKAGDSPLILNIKERLEHRITVQLGVMVDRTSDLADMLSERALTYQRKLNLFITVAISFIAVIGVLFLLSTNRILKSLLKIHEATDFISKEKWDHRIPVRGKDEVSEVAQAFNEMAQRLGETHAALELEIAARKRAEEELLRSNADLEEFAHVASHDLKEPLRKVQAFGVMLAKKCSDSLGEVGRDYLGRIQNAAERMQGLLNSLLEYSRVTNKLQPFKSVDLNESVREALSNLEILIRDKEPAVKVDQLPRVHGDPVQMVQLFQNLISNALKFQRTGERPDIRIHAPGSQRSGKDDACEIWVEDNGIGFEEKHLDKIFAPFQRLHGRSEYEGSGIGLATCKKIVERHGGRITARSRSGKGSTFIVTLPA
jgi:signal transduction histidine kinase